MGKTKELRTRGPKPHDPETRAARVADAVKALQKIGAAFSMADVAARADISRATLYRDPALRVLVGAKGDGPRHVDAALHEKLAARHEASKAKARDLRRQLGEAEAGWDEMRTRALTAESRLAQAERRLEIVAAQMRGGGAGALEAVAARMGPDECRRARRVLARALHPDLFAQDAPTAALATEMLKTLNALAE